MKLSEIVAAVDGTCSEEISGIEISRISSFESARRDTLIFVSKKKFQKKAQASPAAAVLTRENWPVSGKINIYVDDPYWAYAVAAQLFEDRCPLFGNRIDSSAIIDDSANIAEDVAVGPGTVIGANALIGAGTIIDARAVIEPNAVLGENCRIHSGAVIRYGVQIGDECIISSGAVIGSEGFANALKDGEFTRIPCFGTVILQDRVEIGANTTVDRGNFEDTIIRRGARLDNLVQVAHNTEIGESCGIASQVGFAGSTKLGRQVMVGGQAGFAGHISIGDYTFIGAKAGIPGSVGAKEKITGIPAVNILQRRRIDAAEQKLPEALKTLRRLEKEIEQLKERSAPNETKDNP
ncbi:MAG: UDP-3-O-(3-hydroxymyristoyl)glucosamine N-acyltransferase [Fibrobacterota bacterium]